MFGKQKAKEKGKDMPKWMQSSREQQRDKKTFLSEQCKEIEKNREGRLLGGEVGVLLLFVGSAQIRQWEGFLVFGNFSLFKTPFPGWNSIPPSFVPFFVFCIFPYLLLKTWVAFLDAWCPLPAFRSCFVEFTQRLNVLLMNLWGRKCSPHPTPPPS